MHPRRSYGRWRLLFVPPRTRPENMARDIALQARAARSGETVFSIYGWSRPKLSFCRNQRSWRVNDRDKIRAADIDVVRRPTGGRAILHRREVTYSVTAPIDSASLREAYVRINCILQTGLSRLGVRVESVPRLERTPVAGVRSCFEIPAEGELVAQGAKLVGSAQWRND